MSELSATPVHRWGCGDSGRYSAVGVGVNSTDGDWAVGVELDGVRSVAGEEREGDEPTPRS